MYVLSMLDLLFIYSIFLASAFSNSRNIKLFKNSLALEQDQVKSILPNACPIPVGLCSQKELD